MKSLTLSPTLFGIDLRRLGQDWAQALTLMAQWPGVRWLTPPYATQLRQASGQTITVLETHGQTRTLSKPTQTPFWGLLLPEDMVLWHTPKPPPLQSSALTEAIELEVDRLNPFGPEDLLWTHSATPDPSGTGTRLLIALTSRRLVAEHLATHPPSPLQPDKTTPKPEVWTQHPDTGQCLIFAGFGENRRRQRTRNARIVNLLLASLILLVGMAAAVTPSLQLRYRVQQAFDDYNQLQVKSAPAVAAREQMARLQTRVQHLQTLVGNRMVPEYTLLLLTQYIPEHTYLVVIDIKDNTINLSGSTPNATALMQHLGKQPGITQVTAPNPSRRERDREFFNIAFQLQAPPPVALPADTPTPAKP